MDGLTAFSEVYCAAFLLLDHHWLASKASYMEFNQVCGVLWCCLLVGMHVTLSGLHFYVSLRELKQDLQIY